MKIDRNTVWLAIAASLFLGLTVNVRAIWTKYSPFPPNAAPSVFLHTNLKLSRHDSDPMFFEYFKPDDSKPCLRLDWTERDGRVSILKASGSVSFSTTVEGSPICDVEASLTDLNGDAIDDYIVVTHSGGNGLAGQITTITFLLSSINGYVARSVFSFDASPSDLVDLNQDGRPEFVHCMFISGDKGKDGRSHNYWTYNLLGVAGTELVSANTVNECFPKWILYTYDSNHTDSHQLTAEQRQREWLRAWRKETNQQGSLSLPNLEEFAAEQGRTLLRR